MKQLLILMLLSFNLSAQDCPEIDIDTIADITFCHTPEHGNITFNSMKYGQDHINKFKAHGVIDTGSIYMTIKAVNSEPFIEHKGAKIVLVNNYVIDDKKASFKMYSSSDNDYLYHSIINLSALDVAMLKLFRIKAYKIYMDVQTVSPEDGERYKHYFQCLTK